MDEKPLWRMVAGRKVGPYDPAKLRPLVKDGRISPLDRFSYDGQDWRPAGEFSELLRAPAAIAPSRFADPLDSNPLDSDLLGSEAGSADFAANESSDFSDDLVPGPSPTGASVDEARLLKAIYLLIAFGAGMFVLLIGYIIIASLVGGNRPVPPSVPPAATSQPVVMPRPPQPPPSEPVPQPVAPAVVDSGGDEPAVKEPSTKEASRRPATGATPDPPQPAVPENAPLPAGDGAARTGEESKTE